MKVAALQMTSTPVLQDNIDSAAHLIQGAAQSGATLLLLPEYWPLMGLHEQDKTRLAQSDDAALMTTFMSDMARQYGIYLIGGTIPLSAPDPDKVYNSTLVFDPQGRQIARYDKIHLFGFTKGAESYQESQSIVPGTEPVSFSTDVSGDDTFKVGLSICYDLRFPELYRSFGAVDLLVVPDAFTYTTG